MFGIPGPPPPDLTDPAAYGVAAACLVVGVPILLWGRNLSRATLCVAGMGAGLALAGPLARRMAWNLTAVRTAAGVTLALVGLVLARLIWALLAAMLFGALAECITLARCLGEIPEIDRPVFQAADSTLACWAAAVVRFGLDGLAVLFRLKATTVLAAIGPAVMLPLAIGLFRDRLARIVMTSLLGGAALAAGCVIALVQLRPSLWAGICIHWYVPLGVAAALMVAGVVVQYRGAIEADRSRNDREAEPPQKGKTPAARTAEE